MQLTLHARKQESEDAYSFLFDADQPFDWQPGQYLDYELPHPNPDDWGTLRTFTISSAPEEHQVRLTTRIHPQTSSSFKRALLNLQPGTKIHAEGPEGDFVLDHPDQPAVFVAGGIGITPFRAILKNVRNSGVPVHIDLLYGNQTADIVFREELDRLAKEISGLNIRYFIEPERISAAVIQKHIANWRDQRFFLSGPEPMVLSLQSQLSALGLAENQIRLDAFPNYDWPERSPQAAH